MKDTAHTKRFYTVPEAAEILRLNPQALYRALAAGTLDLDAVRLGRSIRIPAGALAAEALRRAGLDDEGTEQ